MKWIMMTGQNDAELEAVIDVDGNLVTSNDLAGRLNQHKREWLRSNGTIHIANGTFDVLSRCARLECRGGRGVRNAEVINLRTRRHIKRLRAGRRAFCDLPDDEELVPMPRMKEVEGQVGAERFAAEKAKVQRLVCPICDEHVTKKQLSRMSKKQRKEQASGRSDTETAQGPAAGPATDELFEHLSAVCVLPTL